jgi:hypothetical protein
MIVSHPTALENLVIEGWYEQDVYPECSIPMLSLRVYDGPSQLFTVLSIGKGLHTLGLHGDPRAAFRQLRRQQLMDNPILRRICSIARDGRERRV